MNKETASKSLHRNRSIGIAIAVVAVLIIALISGLLFSGGLSIQTTIDPTSSPPATPAATLSPSPTVQIFPTLTPVQTPTPIPTIIASSTPSPSTTPQNEGRSTNLRYNLSVNLSPQHSQINMNQTVNFTSFVTGGTPPYSYQWYSQFESFANPLEIVATTPNFTFTPNSTGTYYIRFTVTDSLGKHTGQFIVPMSVLVYENSITTPTPIPSETPPENIMITMYGTIATSWGSPTRMEFVQMNGFVPPGGMPTSWGPSFTTEVQHNPILNNYNYTIQLPNNQWFALSVSYEAINGTSAVYHFIQPFGLFENNGATSRECSFSWGK